MSCHLAEIGPVLWLYLVYSGSRWYHLFMLEWRTVGRSWSTGAELEANFRSCQPVGVYELKLGGVSSWIGHSAICWEFLLGGAKCLFHGISPPQEKLKRYPPVDCGPHRAPNKSSTRRPSSRSPPGAWSCPCLLVVVPVRAW